MPFHKNGSIRYYTFTTFDEIGVPHAAITRQGGVSPAPWSSLNVGSTVGDETGRVVENRRKAFSSLGISQSTMYDVWQVHSADVVNAVEPRLPQTPHVKADAILTDQSNITLFMRFADCVPILLFDPRKKVVGLVHAGWKGTVLGIAASAIASMQQIYGSRPVDVLAAIGPSICLHHYKVGPEVVAQVKVSFGRQAKQVLQPANGAVQFDLWEANRLILLKSGVKRIESAGICTACNLADWYSHRGENGSTGRFGVLIAL